jgi:hypothetical protein
MKGPHPRVMARVILLIGRLTRSPRRWRADARTPTLLRAGLLVVRSGLGGAQHFEGICGWGLADLWFDAGDAAP